VRNGRTLRLDFVPYVKQDPFALGDRFPQIQVPLVPPSESLSGRIRGFGGRYGHSRFGLTVARVLFLGLLVAARAG
jgi:hypothetical protein